MADFFRADAAELAEDARSLLAELDRDAPGVASLHGECRPPLDIFETTDAIQVLIDIPGVAVDSLRVAVRRNTVLLVGAKQPMSTQAGARHHLAERAYGRFARAIRVSGAVDPTRATAVVVAGQLRVTLPRIEDRRGRVISVPVTRG